MNLSGQTEPRKSYKDRLFTHTVTGWPGVKHIQGRDYQPLIEAALAAPGFTEVSCNARYCSAYHCSHAETMR